MIDNVRAEPRLPALLDDCEQRPPYLLRLAAFGSGANQPVAARRVWAAGGRTWIDVDVATPVHAVEVGFGEGELHKFAGAHVILADELHAVRPHH